MSLRKVVIQKTKVTHIEQICNRFFMITKEVHNLACKLKVNNKLSENDWARMMQEGNALKS